jgi:hypothetical protein
MNSAIPGRHNRGRLSPLLLAGGLGLFWLAETRESGLEAHVPAWGLALVLASRLFVGIVGGWVLVSVLRLIVMLGRLGLARWRPSKTLATQ